MRKLSLPFVITFVLSLVSSGKQQGVDGQLGYFVRNAKRNKAFDKIEAVHRSSITRARLKISWQLFENLFYRVVNLAYEVFPHREEYLWEGLNVIAIDGSKYRLPASKEIRSFFDPKSGFENKGRGHYPLCLVSTAYDVFRRIPIARTITPYNDANERQDAIGFVDKIPSNSVVLLDRGYTGYELVRELSSREDIFFSIRCPITSTFSVLREFMDGKKKDGLLEIGPTSRFLTKYGIKKFREAPKIKLRAIKWKAPDGTMSLLVTNLTDRKKYTKAKVIGLYFKRWAVETHFRDEKVSFNVE